MKTYALCEGINLHLIRSNKYKDFSIYFNFYNYINAKSRVQRALLTHIIGNRSKLYDDKVKMTREKDLFYGAVIGLGNMTISNGHIFQLNGKILNERFTKETYLKEFLEFLNEILKNAILDDESLKEAKKNLVDSSKRKKDNQMISATSRVYEIYGANSYLKELAIMEAENIENQTLKDVEKAYDDLLNEDNLDIFVFGDFEEDKIVDLIKDVFRFKERKFITHSFNTLNINLKEHEVVETKRIKQATLVMLFKTNIKKNTKMFLALKVANALFGMVPSSLLFQEVREKNSLCYSINSSILGEEGIMLVRTSIDQKNSDLVIKLIKEQFENIKNGNFDESRLKESTKLYTNMIKGINDDILHTMNYEYTKYLDKRTGNIESDIIDLLDVSKDEVIAAFNQIELQLTYLLKNEGGVNDEENL